MLLDSPAPSVRAGSDAGHGRSAATTWETLSHLPGVVRRRFPAHATVPLPESVPMVLFIEEGAMGRQLRRDHEPAIVEVLGAGSWMCTSDTDDECQGAEWSLVTLAPTTVLQLPRATFRIACAGDVWLGEQALESERRRQRALLARLAVLCERSSTRRVARTLLYLADAMGESCPIGRGLRLSLPQHVIAATVDLARQTTNRELRRLHQSRVLHIERGMVCLVDRELLMEVASGGLLVRPAMRPATCKLRYPEMPLDCEPISLRRA